MAKIRKMISMTSEVSTASMSDIAFLLIVFFMVASVFTIKDGLHLTVPDKNKKPVIISAQDVITVTVPDSDRIFIDSKPVAMDDFETILAGLSGEKKRHVLLKINRDVPYHRAVSLIDAVKYTGITRLSVKML